MPPALCGGYCSSRSTSARTSADSFGQEAPPRHLAHAADDLGALVGGEALQDLAGAAGVHLLEDRAAAVEGRLVEDLDRPRHREHAHDRGRLLAGELVDEVGDVGGLQLRHHLADPDEALVEAEADPLEQVLGGAHLRRPPPLAGAPPSAGAAPPGARRSAGRSAGASSLGLRARSG